MQVFGENAAPILDRHFVACERREARAEFEVQGVERGSKGYDIRHRSPRLEQTNAKDTTAARDRFQASPPLSGDLRDFPHPKRLPPSVGRGAKRRDRFPERHHPTVHWPERFRGGCAFGAGMADATPDSSAGCLRLTWGRKPEGREFVNAGRKTTEKTMREPSVTRAALGDNAQLETAQAPAWEA